MRLHIRVFGAKKFFGAVNRQLFRRIHVFTPAIPALARVPFGVLVREHRTLRLQDRRTGEIFAGDQFNVLLLPLPLEPDGVGHVRVNRLQSQCGRRFQALDLAHATGVPAAFEMHVEKSIHDLLRLFRAHEFTAQTKHVGVVVLPGQRRHFFVEDQRGADARHLVGRDAHPDTGGAYEKPEVAFLFGDVVRHGLREVRIVGGNHRGGAEVQDLQPALFEMLLERLLQLVAGMIGAESHDDGSVLARAGSGAVGGLVDEFQEGGNPLFDLVAAIEINLVRTADRVGDVLFKNVQSLIKLAEQESFLGCLRIKQVDGIDVPVRHAENIIGLAHNVRGEHATALLRDVNAQFLQSLHCVRAGRLAFNRPHSCRQHAKIAATPGRMPEKALRHGAATNIPRANEKNGFHARDNDFKLGRAGEKSTAKSARQRPFDNRNAFEQIERARQRRVTNDRPCRVCFPSGRRCCRVLVLRIQSFALHPYELGLVEPAPGGAVGRSGLRDAARHSQRRHGVGQDFERVGKVSLLIFAADRDFEVGRYSRCRQRLAFADPDLPGGHPQSLSVRQIEFFEDLRLSRRPRPDQHRGIGLAQRRRQHLGGAGRLLIHEHCDGKIDRVRLRRRMSGTLVPVQERLFLRQESVRRVRCRRVILARGETQIEDQPFQFVPAAELFISRLDLVRQPRRHPGHAHVSIRFIVHRRPGQQCVFLSGGGRRAVGDQNRARIKLIQQPLDRGAVQVFFGHARQVGAQQAEDFLKMREVICLCA